MSLVICPECGNSTSDMAIACPKCGFPINLEPEVPPLRSPAPPQLAATPPVLIQQSKVKRPSPKFSLWLAMFAVASLIASPIMPGISLGFGIILLVLCLVAFVPFLQSLARGVLQLDPSNRIRRGIKLAMFWLLGAALFLSGLAGASFSEKKVAERAEDNVQKARELQKQQPLVKEANAKVEALVADVRNALAAGALEVATQKLNEVFMITGATEMAEAHKVRSQIACATDTNQIRAMLMALPEWVFLEFKDTGELPPLKLTGYESLDHRKTELAKVLVDEVAKAREKAAKIREKRQLAALEGDVHGAWVYMQSFVKDRLKSPKSAKFPFGGFRDVRDLGGGRYEVNSYVDAQNSFGALLRVPFKGVIKKGDGQWRLESLNLVQ